MMSILIQLFPNIEKLYPEFVKSIGQTLQMLGISGVFAFVFGLFFGVLLIVTKKGGILENRFLYVLIDKCIDIIRSIPFIIFMMLLFPLSRIITGSAIGVKGAIVPLVLGTVPFFARQIESAIAEVDKGLIEAAIAMGDSPIQIIFRVYLKECIPSIARVTMVTAINLIGLTTMAGAVGAGGIGDFAIRNGHTRGLADMVYLSVIVILIIVSIIQFAGSIVIKLTKH